MPNKRANDKNEKQYEALKDDGMSKERAATIATLPTRQSRVPRRRTRRAPAAAHRSVRRAQKRAARRNGGKATAAKS